MQCSSLYGLSIAQGLRPELLWQSPARRCDGRSCLGRLAVVNEAMSNTKMVLDWPHNSDRGHRMYHHRRRNP